MDNDIILKLEDINMSFKGHFLEKTEKNVLRNVSFEVYEKDTLAILGESGSGKTTLAYILLLLLKQKSGKYYFLGHELYKEKIAKKVLRENISVVFQDYTSSVNPKFTVFDIIKESLNLMSKRKKISYDMTKSVVDLLEKVGLSKEYIYRFPHELSGGQMQRVSIARAIALEPKVIILDEALNSLDSHIQVQIMDLLKELQTLHGYTYIFITHDLTAVTYMCNRVLFLHEGRIVENCDVLDLYKVKNDYAKKLIHSVIDM